MEHTSFEEVMEERLRSSTMEMVETLEEWVIGLICVAMKTLVGVYNDLTTTIREG